MWRKTTGLDSHYLVSSPRRRTSPRPYESQTLKTDLPKLGGEFSHGRHRLPGSFCSRARGSQWPVITDRNQKSVIVQIHLCFPQLSRSCSFITVMITDNPKILLYLSYCFFLRIKITINKNNYFKKKLSTIFKTHISEQYLNVLSHYFSF